MRVHVVSAMPAPRNRLGPPYELAAQLVPENDEELERVFDAIKNAEPLRVEIKKEEQ